MDEPVVDPVVEPVVEPVVDTPVTDEYSFETWRQSLDEGLRDEKSLQSFKNAKDQNELTAMLAKSFTSTKRMVGQNVIAVPNETSSQAERDAFHVAGGRPDTVEDYALKAPKDMPPELVEQIFPEAKVKAWQERFFKAGVSKKDADQFISEFAKDMTTDYQTMKQAEETAKEAVMDNLATTFGAALEQKLHMGDMAMEDFSGGDQEIKESLAYLRKDPVAIKMLAHFGGFLAEGKGPNFSAVPTPSDLQEQVETLMADPLYQNGTTKQRMNIANKIQELKKKQFPEPK